MIAVSLNVQGGGGGRGVMVIDCSVTECLGGRGGGEYYCDIGVMVSDCSVTEWWGAGGGWGGIRLIRLAKLTCAHKHITNTHRTIFSDPGYPVGSEAENTMVSE